MGEDRPRDRKASYPQVTRIRVHANVVAERTLGRGFVCRKMCVCSASLSPAWRTRLSEITRREKNCSLWDFLVVSGYQDNPEDLTALLDVDPATDKHRSKGRCQLRTQSSAHPTQDEVPFVFSCARVHQRSLVVCALPGNTF